LRPSRDASGQSRKGCGLHGFSGGSQFTHRFAMLHPKLVCGVSAHSGSTWATDGYGEFSLMYFVCPFE
jgi:hypothetical protein